MNLSTCALCTSTLTSDNNIYRAFDNTFCSKRCLNIKCDTIDTIDPGYRTPSKWHKSKSQTIINISENTEKPNEEIPNEEIPNEEILNEEIPKESITINISNLSLIQYSQYIACTFGIEGIKKVLSNSHPMPLLL